MHVSEFTAWLRTQTSPKTKRPFQEQTIIEHGQGGTNNRQRNLHHLFKWLARSYGHPDPWASPELVRYGPVKSRPSTLAEDFIRDLGLASSPTAGWCRS